MIERRSTGPDSFWQKADAHVITTNGVVKANGEAVMGGGIAAQAAERFPSLPYELGRALSGNKPGCYIETNVPFLFHHFEGAIITMPTKHDWRKRSPMELVMTSAVGVAKLARKHNMRSIFAVPPGCGLGGLSWPEVREHLSSYWDDKFTMWLM